jgi:hypothetical protein
MRRVAPAIALFFLSPLVAEFLLGDFGIGALYVLIGLAPMYGGGAIVIREVVRRTGRGWPSIVLLALAYGVLEEGFTTQSLFNPDYLDAHLLEHGFVPALGIAIPWTVFVLTIHTVWSMSVPIELVEEYTGRRTTPWLRTPGMIVAWCLFVFGAVIDFLISYSDGHFLAPWPRLLVTGVVIVLLVVAALRLPRRSEPRPPIDRAAPAPWIVLVATLVTGGLLLSPLNDHLGAFAVTSVLVIAIILTVAALGYWSRCAGWGPWHRFAAAAGGLLTYAWHAFTMEPFAGGGPVLTPVSHVVFTLAALALLVRTARSIRRREDAPVDQLPGDAPVPVTGS